MTTVKRRNQHKIEPREIYGTSLRRKPLDSSVFVTELASNKFHFAMCSNFRKPHENVPGVFFGPRKRSGNNLESHGRSSGPVGSDHNFNSWNLLAWRMGFFLKLYLYVICTVRSSDAFSFICSNSALSLKVTCVTSVLAPQSRARKHQRPAPPPLPSPPLPPKKPSKHIFIDGVVSQMIPGRKWSPDRKWSPKFDRKWIVENLIKDQSNFALVIISLILIIFSLDNVRTLLGEILCWSLLGPKNQIRSLLIGKLTWSYVTYV